MRAVGAIVESIPEGIRLSKIRLGQAIYIYIYLVVHGMEHVVAHLRYSRNVRWKSGKFGGDAVGSSPPAIWISCGILES